MVDAMLADCGGTQHRLRKLVPCQNSHNAP
jgi:hypothetical protein